MIYNTLIFKLSSKIWSEWCENFSTITISSTVYQVICIIFSAKSFIGRATRVFLVQLPDGSKGILKDSWIPPARSPELKFLEGLAIPFGPQIIDHDILWNTGTLWAYSVEALALDECQEKHCIIIYPAGVHITDFTSLLELMAAFMDIVIGMYNKFHDFFFCYLIQYLFHSYHLPWVTPEGSLWHFLCKCPPLRAWKEFARDESKPGTWFGWDWDTAPQVEVLRGITDWLWLWR